MITICFGLPGAGKSSYGVWLICDTLFKMDNSKSCYKRIYTNIDHSIPDDRVITCSYTDMKTHDLGDGSLCVIDEGQLEFSDRGFKSFSREDIDFFVQHRRYGYDIVIMTQQWDGIDRKIRVITNKCLYMVKGKVFSGITHVYPVPYGILIPKRGETESAKYGEIIQGYYKWGWLDQLFHTRVLRFPVYGLYDTFARPTHLARHEAYQRWLDENEICCDEDINQESDCS